MDTHQDQVHWPSPQLLNEPALHHAAVLAKTKNGVKLQEHTCDVSILRF